MRVERVSNQNRPPYPCRISNVTRDRDRRWQDEKNRRCNPLSMSARFQSPKPKVQSPEGHRFDRQMMGRTAFGLSPLTCNSDLSDTYFRVARWFRFSVFSVFNCTSSESFTTLFPYEVHPTRCCSMLMRDVCEITDEWEQERVRSRRVCSRVD